MADIPDAGRFGNPGANSRSSGAAPSPTRHAAATAPRQAPIHRPISSIPVRPPTGTTANGPQQASGYIWVLAIIAAIGLLWIFQSTKEEAKYVEYFSERTVHVIPASHVNARNGPGTEFDISGVVAPNTRLAALGEAEDQQGDIWIAVKTNDGNPAYIKARLLQRVP